jgi:small subunit ribosomal protein S8
MTMTDPIADLLTQIRNAILVDRAEITMPHSQMREGVLRVLRDEGFIANYTVIEQTPQKAVTVTLKYGPNGEHVIRSLQRVSKPGRRAYSGAGDLKRVLQGQGISIVSTTRGILSSRECRQHKVGGEVLAEVY